EREHVLAPARQRGRRDGQVTLAVLLGEQRQARGDASQDGHRSVCHGRVAGGRERAGRAAGAGPPLQLALALERAEVIERRARRDLEPRADLPHRRRHPVTGGERPDEAQYLPLPLRQLAHAPPLLEGISPYSTRGE